MPNLTKIVNLVREIYKSSGFKEPRRRGKKTFTDSYICQMVVVQNLKGFTNESAFIRYLETHKFKAFPKVPTQSCYNHRAKELRPIVETLVAELLKKLEIERTKIRTIDATAVPVTKYYRRKNTRAFRDKEIFGIGYCAAKKQYYYGQKLTLVVTKNGIPVNYHLMPANRHDIKGLPPAVRNMESVWLIADKGYVGKKLKQKLRETRRIRLITPLRKNQKLKLTEWEKRKLKHRQLIEVINAQLKDHFQLENLKAKSAEGIQSRIRNILFSFLIAIYFNKINHRNLLSIKEILG